MTDDPIASSPAPGGGDHKNIGLYLKDRLIDFEIWDWILLGGILLSVFNAPMIYQVFGGGMRYAAWGILTCLLCFSGFCIYLVHLATAARSLLIALGVLGSLEFFVSFVAWIILVTVGFEEGWLAVEELLSYSYGMFCASAWASGAFVRFGQTQ